MIKLDKKKIIILGSALCIVLVGVLLFIFLGNKNDDNNSISSNINRTKLLSGYANDTEEKIKKGIYQPFEKSDITFKVYGQEGYDDLTGTNLAPVEMTTKCDEEEEKSNTDDSTTSLGKEPVEVKNHCTISFSWQYNTADIVTGNDEDYARVLVAFVELPDGSLISFSGSNDIQINIYENETRIVMEEGTAYFRIVSQADGKVFTVQVGDKIFQTIGPAEFFTYSKLTTNSYNVSRTDDYEGEIKLFRKLSGNEKFLEYLESKFFSYYIASFQVISGNVDIYTRGTNEKMASENKEYYYVYYQNYYSDDEKAGGYLTTRFEDMKYNSLGAFVTEKDEQTVHKEFYIFLEDQKELNKLSYGFDNVTVKKANITEMMKNYLTDFNNKAKQLLADYNANKKEETSACSYSWFLSMEDNCGCDEGWYFISHVGCCPNGYTYSVSENKCIKTTIVSSCPSGTYYVGNDKCCKNGTTLSSNGLSCVASSGTKSTPSYYPNSNDGATKTPYSKIKTNNSSTCRAAVQCEAKGNSACVAGMYEKDGKCCMDLVCVE